MGPVMCVNDDWTISIGKVYKKGGHFGYRIT